MRIHFLLGKQAGVTRSALVAFGAAFDVEFIPAPPQTEATDALVIIGADYDAELARRRARRVFIALSGNSAQGETVTTIDVCGPIPGRPWLRHRSLRLPKALRVSPLDPSPGAEIMARCAAGPIWIREQAEGVLVDRVALPLPLSEPSPDCPVFVCVSPDTFPFLLPLIQFVREVTGEVNWQSSLKACFMFDDPNLHATSYGYIDFAELVKHARREHYHVSFATVPLDAWYTSAKAAAIFRDNRDVVSLLIHGNDHVDRELGRDYREADRVALLAQALRRINKLSVQSGVEICRVMAAPHGLCSEDIMQDMARLGFTAACVSNGSVRPRVAPKTIGSRPAEMIGGLPVIPRFGIGPACFQTALMAAYLDQPIIPTGHHQDVAAGFDLLDTLAEQINSLGTVHWRPMSEIANTLFQSNLQNGTLQVRPFTRRVCVVIPAGAARLRVTNRSHHATEATAYAVTTPDSIERVVAPGDSIPIAAGATVWITAMAPPVLSLDSVPSRGTKLSAILRRIACEARDRVAPLTPGR